MIIIRNDVVTEDTCPEGKTCKDTQACTGDAHNKTCGSGRCVSDDQISPSPTPKEGDTCRRAITDPGGGGCGPNMQCELNGKNCSGTHLDQACDGTCKPKPEKGDTCQSSPGLHDSQGNCPEGLICKPGASCSSTFCEGKCEEPEEEEPALPAPPPPPCAQAIANGQCSAFFTAFGEIATDPTGFLQTIFAVLLAMSGGIALLLIIRAGYMLMTSAGNPERIKEGREQLIAAIVGLIFIIFSFVILQVIGIELLKLPDFTQSVQAPTNTGALQVGSSCDVNGTAGACPAGSTCVADATGGRTGVCKSNTGAGCDVAGNGPQCPTGQTCVSTSGGRAGTCQ